MALKTFGDLTLNSNPASGVDFIVGYAGTTEQRYPVESLTGSLGGGGGDTFSITGFSFSSSTPITEDNVMLVDSVSGSPLELPSISSFTKSQFAVTIKNTGTSYFGFDAIGDSSFEDGASYTIAPSGSVTIFVDKASSPTTYRTSVDGKDLKEHTFIKGSGNSDLTIDMNKYFNGELDIGPSNTPTIWIPNKKRGNLNLLVNKNGGGSSLTFNDAVKWPGGIAPDFSNMTVGSSALYSLYCDGANLFGSAVTGLQ